MAKLLANFKNGHFDYQDKNANIVRSVANMLYPIRMVKMLDVSSESTVELETMEGGVKRTFEVVTGSLASMEGLQKVLFENHYFIDYRLVNPLRTYLTDCLRNLQSQNAIEYAHKSLGFHKDTDGSWVFLLGKTKTVQGLSEYYDKEFEFQSGAFLSYDKFIRQEILPKQELQLALVMGLASVPASYLKDYADVQTIVVNLCGPSSTGKSTTAQLIASFWGNPKISNRGMVKTFNMTSGAMFTEIEGMNGVAIVLDDITTAAYINKTQLIYQLAQGESRARLNNYGKEVKQGLPFSGLAIITSETPVLSEAETRQGLIARVLDVDDIVWTKDADHSTRVKNHIMVNFGLLGPKFVDFFMAKDDAVIKKDFESSREIIRESIPKMDNLSHRIINKLAIIHMTAVYVKGCFGYDLDLEYIKQTLIEIDQHDIEDRHIAIRGFESIKQYITKHHSQFDKFDDKGMLIQRSSNQLMGVMKYFDNHVTVAIPSENVKSILQNARIHEYRPVLKYWKDNDMIVTQSGRKTINIKELNTRVVQFMFEKSGQTILPWYPTRSSVHTNVNSQIAPSFDETYDDSEEIEAVFEESGDDENQN
jgi:hypothetical protein